MATADPGAGSFTPINIWAMLRMLINNFTPLLNNAGAPTNGTSGTFAGQAGPGALLIDFTNAVLYINIGTLASPTWVTLGEGSQPISLSTLSVNGAIPIASRSYVITKVGVLADTLAAPAASPGGDGVLITITSDNANLHTITFTGGTLDSGGAGVTTATFNANKGASLTVVSYNGRWKVLNANGVSFS
jgi:hypothetical protein